MIYNTYCE